jgi:signal transduction histidine kinase
MGRPVSPVWRVLGADSALAAAVGAVIVLVAVQADEWAVPSAKPFDGLGYTIIAVSAGLLALRRTWPVSVLAATVALAAVYLVLGYAFGPFFLPLGIAMYTVAMRLRWRASLLASSAAFLAVAAAHLLGAEQDLLLLMPLTIAGAAGWIALPWALGTVVSSRLENTARNREEEARRRAYEERLLIAREVHDVLGQSLAVINMQAGIALHVVDRRPEQTKESLQAIKKTSKEALDDLRGTLAVFRRRDGITAGASAAGAAEAPRTPTPGMSQLDNLISSMSKNGLSIHADVRGERGELPSAVDLAAYRIVQESLTNALRHAGPASVAVTVDYRPDRIVVDVSDDGRGCLPGSLGTPGRTTGQGIVGMAERAAALGGTLDAKPRPEGGFRVHACLPLGEGTG